MKRVHNSILPKLIACQVKSYSIKSNQEINFTGNNESPYSEKLMEKQKKLTYSVLHSEFDKNTVKPQFC